MNSLKKFFNNILIFIIIISVVFVGVIYYYNSEAAIISLVIVCGIIIFLGNMLHKNLKLINKDIKNLEIGIDNFSRETILKFPYPIAKIGLKGENGEINWKNPAFEDAFPDAANINELISHEELAYMLGTGESRELFIGDNKYIAILNRINEIEIGSHYIIYFIDKSDYFNLLTKYEDEKKVACLIFVDNYYELAEGTHEDKDLQVFSEVDKRLNYLASRTTGILKKYDRDKYLFIFDKQHLEEFKLEKFSILDEIRMINTQNEIPVTLSIGVGDGGNNLIENVNYAKSAIELALGRGGDHAVIKNFDKLSFYGGKTKEVEKRSKVRARVIAHAMVEIIKQSDRVVIMGHKVPDVDCVGASIGLSRGIKNYGKDVNIVLNSVTPPVEALVNKIKKNEEFEDIFINSEEALEISTASTLVIVLDTHRPDSVECPELLNYQDRPEDRIMLIDHHRRGKDFIDNTLINYLEPYASSTCELVTELIQYMGDGVKLSVIEAEAMLAGIIVDTKNFCFKTGVRTFEAASFLRKSGANSTVVRQLFQNDLNTFLERYNIVKNAEIFNEKIAIAACSINNDKSSLAVAQAADELLTIQGIQAAFVLCQTEQEILISGRSFGDINVQVILESLGGGGHFTIAGAQLKGISLEDAKQKLKEAVMNVNQD
jgi:c-di-AMP phosphodiesterase-like protein